jgi:hypothetical protein
MTEIAGLSPLELQKRVYYPLCTPSEIERVFNPRNAKDYLLALRSHYIIDNMRIFRFFLRARRAQGNRYSLERNFDDGHYRRYLAMLTPKDQEKLSAATFGDVFTREPTGQIFSSPFGRIVTISRSLRYFLEYSHLALKKLSVEVPIEIRMPALLIALRVMFQHEAMDFEADPRGRLSRKLKAEIRRNIPSQLQFIAGHEFAHHLLDHLSDARLHDSSMRTPTDALDELSPARIYSTSQQQEFSADLAALMNPTNFRFCAR